MKDTGNVVCYCGSRATLRPNSVIYNGKTFGNGMAYICERFPACRGSVGVHPDGRPLGTIPDQETKKLRMKVHAAIDPIWKNATNGRSKKKNRGSVYGWLRRIMGAEHHVHVGEFSKEECLKALDLIAKNPYETR
jgi:hypothetical protein